MTTQTANVQERVHGNILELRLTGKLSRHDYLSFVPDTEKLIREHGKIRVLVILDEFHGWDAGALWEDIKWDIRHFNDIERVAIVGETKWHKGMAAFCKPFTAAKVRYFEHPQIDQAILWVESV